MNFSDRVAIVTGGAQGVGKAISTALLEVGMKILICDINESAGQSFVEEVAEDLEWNVIFQKCDVSSFDEMKVAFAIAKSTYGRIDVVINNAGVLNEKQWKNMIDVNFTGVAYGTNLAFLFMGINNGGSGGFVINVASNAGLRGFHLAPIYSATKHAIVGLTRSFGHQYHFHKTGITVNAVCPGPIDSKLFHTFPSCCVDEELGIEHNSKMNPISPDEVAKAVMKLLQDGKNGALLRVDSEGMRYEE